MEDFGSALRQLRLEADLRQQDLVDVLERPIARSTLTNVEVGREPPTPRLWAAIEQHLPAWLPQLTPLYEAARREVQRSRSLGEPSDTATSDESVGGPYFLESVAYTYVFRHSKAPEEIIGVRRVRALKAGVHWFGLRLTHTRSPQFALEQEALWGGQLDEHRVEQVDGSTAWLRRFTFDRRLQKGQVHEFAVRSWVDADPAPGHAVCFQLTIPAREVTLNLLFNGPHTPRQVWLYAEPDDVGRPAEEVPPADPDDPAWLFPVSEGRYSRRWRSPDLHVEHGVSWAW